VERTENTAVERKRAKNRRYYLANKKRLNEYSSAYQKEHRPKLNAQRRASYDEAKKAAKKAYYERNKERILEQKREYFVRKIDVINVYRTRMKKEISTQNSRWHRQNRDKIRDRKREESRRRMLNPHNRVAGSVRRRIGMLMKGKSKPDRSEGLLGCSFSEFIQYISAMFKPGMTMENYGRKWHIDHIMPCSAFDLTREDQVRQCCHFTNLRPLWAKANLRKSSKITDPQLRLLL
jgi:hypothetical protein